MIKTAGVGDVLRATLAPLADRIEVALIYESFARGEEQRGTHVDLLVVGDLTFSEVASALGEAQTTLGREINPTVYPPREFHSKLREGHHFLTAVSKEPHIFIIRTGTAPGDPGTSPKTTRPGRRQKGRSRRFSGGGREGGMGLLKAKGWRFKAQG